MTDPILIPLQEMVILPAKAEVVAPLKWLTAIAITTPAPGQPGVLVIEYRPMTETGQIIYTDVQGRDTKQVIHVSDLYALKDTVPELAAAFAAVLLAVNPVEVAIAAAESSESP